MEDSRIIQLYWDRSGEAIPATDKKYGGYCAAIAKNILGSREDAEECVNDTWLRAWNSMPPQRPNALAAFLGRITRNLSFNRYNELHTAKRGGGELPAVLDELAECVSGRDDVEDACDQRELAAAINSFLAGLPKAQRGVFVCRYFYSDSVADIAARYGQSAGGVSVTLGRLRKRLAAYLAERGFAI